MEVYMQRKCTGEGTLLWIYDYRVVSSLIYLMRRMVVGTIERPLYNMVDYPVFASK